MSEPTTSPASVARELFAPIATDYERWATWLSLGQDPRWRRTMVDGLDLAPGASVLDIAAGTGSITRLLQARGADVVSLDQSEPMLAMAAQRGATAVVATAEHLPFPDGSFDAVTFGYLLRYVDSIPGCLTEVARVLRPGGVVGMVEFGRPSGFWRPAWWLYTRVGLPVAGALIRSGWWEVGRFLGPDIDRFANGHPPGTLAAEWRRAGFTDVEVERPSLGGGLVMWARKP